MDKYFSNRRTIRRYSDREVSDSLIDSILEAAMRAPTCGNMQLYSVVVNRDPEMIKRLAPTHFNQPSVMGCGALLTVCADFNRFTRWCRLSKADPGFDNFLSFLNAATDAIVFAQQIVTVAEMEGLGTCWLGTVTYNAESISEILELPDLVVPVAALTLGWPDESPDLVERLPLRAIRHDEKYRADSDEQIVDLFKAKDDFAPNAKYVEENNKETLAQVFTDCRYPRSMNEDFSKSFIAHLRKRGFLPEK
ncbi:MAG: NADPH-dependent oxidoreductase [Bacteroidales bacterium]|nr:NADPH-dependent oxidoreductase [Bacteroidales bacterium]